MALTPTCRLRLAVRVVRNMEGELIDRQVLQQWWAGDEGSDYNGDTEELGDWIDVPEVYGV